jgi:hypothetical protein
MKKETALATAPVQERLAYAWAVAQCSMYRSPLVSDRVLNRCRDAAYQLTLPEALQLLSEVPHLAV